MVTSPTSHTLGALTDFIGTTLHTVFCSTHITTVGALTLVPRLTFAFDIFVVFTSQAAFSISSTVVGNGTLVFAIKGTAPGASIGVCHVTITSDAVAPVTLNARGNNLTSSPMVHFVHHGRCTFPMIPYCVLAYGSISWPTTNHFDAIRVGDVGRTLGDTGVGAVWVITPIVA